LNTSKSSFLWRTSSLRYSIDDNDDDIIW
jgi:hypothetical protein